MVGLRAALGIDPEKYADFAQLRRKVLQVAKAEIDQLAHFTVEWDEIRRGRAVIELAFRFAPKDAPAQRSEEHTSELQSLMRLSYAVFCLQKNTYPNRTHI